MKLGGAACLLVAVVVAACQRKPADTSWHQERGYRWRELDVPMRGAAGFKPLDASATGITHRNDVADDSAVTNRHLLLGAGAAAGDVDNDGLPDLFVASVQRPAVLYRNVGGLRFNDITASAGLDTKGIAAMSAAFADLNGDGNLDLVVGTLGGPLKLWRGDGRGQFTDATADAGLASGFAATTMTIADVDGDSDLDLYVGTYKTVNSLDAHPPQSRAFDQVVKKVGGTYVVVDQWKSEYRIEERREIGAIVRSQRAEPDLFYLNDGKGRFTRVPQSGARFTDADGKPLAADPDYFTLASRFYDVNDDGAPDLYVCNDFEDPDQFWINDGKGSFRLAPWNAVRETSNTCMSVDFADLDRDGHTDFFTADMMSPMLAQRQKQFPTHTSLPKPVGLPRDRQQWMKNVLQLSRGDGTWASIGDFAGVSATDWTWGSAFLDVDLDGYEDLIAVNGHRWDVRDADTFERIRNSFPRVPWNKEQREFPPSATRSFVFRNNGDLTFRDMSRAWRIGSAEAISHGIALADFDGDGDLDVVVTRLNATPVIYRNESPAHRVAVRLMGSGANRQGIGARVTVIAHSLPRQSREVTAGGYYLSGSDPLLVFAAGQDSGVTIEVRWRSGATTVVAGARPDRLYEVDESTAAPTAVRNSASAPLFEDATRQLGGHTHADTAFDDYARQPLLPTKFSQLGPGVTWTDVDNDGRVDLVVGAGRGSRLAVLRNTGDRFTSTPLGGPVAGDLTTVLPIPDGRGGVSLVAGQSNYETTSINAALALPRVVGFPRQSAIIAGDSAAVGPLALGDVNGDGRLDLFVGARVVPGLWPLPASSRLYLRNADGTWSVDSLNGRTLSALGLVSAALFTDLSGDGRPELVTTAEWGPVRVFLNEGGRLRDVTRDWGLSGRTSRWNGLSSGDFDGDGRLDLIVTSWGRNTPWEATPSRPYVLITGDFRGQGLGLLFARQDSVTKKEMPLESFSRVGLAVPSARERIAGFADYSRATVDDVLGDLARGAVRIGATTFDHTLLLNRGGSLTALALAGRAQLAPAFAPVVADFNGDGREDLFLAQNFSPTEIETPRFDAGAGLLLLGDGGGGLVAQSVTQSGIRVLGDQRGAAAADYDHDGRVDLAVSQNGAPTTLWRNTRSAQGLRVLLNAGADNPHAVGAQLRVLSQRLRGPVREIRAGSGYWSVDDPTTVLALPANASALWIRWPGGVEQTVPLAAGQREITVTRASP